MKKRILIVDDEPAIVRLLSLRLQSKNFEVLAAYNGLECVKIAQKEIPDLILMDIMMPFLDGVGAFEELLKIDITNTIPVVFMTAYPKLELKNKVLEMGAKGCISKPFISEDFEDTIAMTIA